MRFNALAVLCLLGCAVAAHATDTYSGGTLQIPSIAIGDVTYSNLAVTIGTIVSGPAGSAAAGSGDVYDPVSRLLTVPAVTVGDHTYYNVVATVARLVSIGGQSGADSYDGRSLIVPRVQILGQAQRSNVVVSVASVVRVEGGMPTLVQDEYIPQTNQLVIPAVAAYGRVLTNVVDNVGSVIAGGSGTVPGFALGNGTGGAFVAGAIAVGTQATVAAHGSAGLSLTVVDTNEGNTLDNLGSVTVNFSSPCLNNGTAQILPLDSQIPTQSITTATGLIAATYVANGCSGTDQITATATIGGATLAASGSVTVAPDTIGSIQFVSASSTALGLKGTGLNQTSTVTFKVLDSSGFALPGVAVGFALSTSVGGLSLSPVTAISASDGTVRTVVSAGTVHGVVRVTATIPAVASGPNPSPELSTQSNGLTVTAGLPTSGSFSISLGKASNAPAGAAACPNVEAFGINLVTVPVTVQLADRYNNPVPDGTPVAFHTDGGTIGGSCTTPLNSPGDGACAVTWTSSNPRPGVNPTTGAIDLSYGYPFGYTPLLAAGRTVILATTIGEESFTDVNGTGFYQSGDPYSNLGDPYEADNELPVYQAGDYFIDFYQQQHYTGPSGSFVGITCTGVTPADTCAAGTLAIGASHLLVMSTSAAQIRLVSNSGFQSGTPAPGLNIGAGATGTISVNVADLNGNAMPAGTTVAWSFSNPNIGATLAPVGPATVGCDASLGGAQFEASFATTAGMSGSGTLYIAITAPSGTQTQVSIPITVQS